MRDLSAAHIRRCVECGAEIPPMTDARRTFCDKTCSNRHFNGLTAQARAEARAGRTCPECGTEFEGTRADQVYCGTTCGARASRAEARSRHDKTCRHCGAPFGSSYRPQIYCSHRCYAESRRKS